MLVSIATLASIAAAVAAVFAFGLGVTKTARLRRRELLFREALAVRDRNKVADSVVAELHRAALAEIISRQLTSPWRAVWPWAVWIGLAALTSQKGYVLADYLASDADWSYYDFSTEVFGDSMTPILAVAAILGLLPQVFFSFVFTVVGRAEVARNFFDGKGIEKPASYMQRSLELEYGLRSPKQPRPADESQRTRAGRRSRFAGLEDLSFANYARSLVPGLFVIALGLTIGMVFWMNSQPDQGENARLDSLGGSLGIASFAVVTLGVLTLLAGGQLSNELRGYALPSTYPRTTRALDRQQIRPRSR